MTRKDLPVAASDRPAVIHVFPGHMTQHVPSMLRFFMNHAADLSLPMVTTEFLIYDPSAEMVSAIAHLGTIPDSAGRMVFLEKSETRVYLYLRKRRPYALVLHSCYYNEWWLVLAALPNWRKVTVWLSWGAELTSDVEWSQSLYARKMGGLVRMLIRIGRRHPESILLTVRAVRGALRRFAGRSARLADWMRNLLWVVKVLVIPRIARICTLVPEDAATLRSCYEMSDDGQFRRMFYPVFGFPENEPLHAEHERPIKVLLGNSADLSNGHLELMEALAPFATCDVEIVCPLGYGGSAEYRSEVERRGAELFGARFQPLPMVDLESFLRVLRGIDVLVNNHSRQQGMFSVVYALATGRKIFLRGDSSSFRFLAGEGAVLGDTRSLPGMTFDEFHLLNKSARVMNREVHDRIWSESASCKAWLSLLRTDLPAILMHKESEGRSNVAPAAGA